MSLAFQITEEDVQQVLNMHFDGKSPIKDETAARVEREELVVLYEMIIAED